MYLILLVIQEIYFQEWKQVKTFSDKQKLS